MIDINKKYRTRDGREVRIYATDCGRDGDMVHGAVKKQSEWWEQCSWHKDGRFYGGPHSHELDLIEVRPRHKRTVWMNMYGTGTVPETFNSKKDADRASIYGRIACVKVELDFEEGEGL
jgi:hypothetical protein